MSELSDRKRFMQLMTRQLAAGWPLAVHILKQKPTPGCPLTAFPMPRLSLCLSGTGRYRVIESGRETMLSLKRGHLLYVMPGAGMDPVYQSNYTALGVLLDESLIRLLQVNNQSQQTQHPHQRYTAVTHLPWGPNAAMHHVLCALSLEIDDLSAQRLAGGLLAMLLDQIRLSMQATSVSTGKAQSSFLGACTFIREHFDKPISREDVAQFMKLHPNHISRLFHRFAGRSFGQYLTTIRLEHSRKLLRQANLNIAEIANACGFANANYFIRCYRKAYSRTPSQQPDRATIIDQTL